MTNGGDLDLLSEDKRAPKFSVVAYRCRPVTAQCKNGGIGPRVTMKGGRPICVCLCPKDHRGPQCL